jgi:hypothetical protein
VESCLPVDCPNTAFIQITGKEAGQSGNHAIAFVHGIWLAKKTNSTLLVPRWMMEDVGSDAINGGLQRCYCFTSEKKAKEHEHEHMSMSLGNSSAVKSVYLKDLYYGYRLSEDHRWGLPKYSVAVVDEVSDVFVHAYSAIRSHWHDSFAQYASDIISTTFAGAIKYTGVHKRQLDGLCDGYLVGTSQEHGFNGSEISLRGAYWEGVHKPPNEIECLIRDGKHASTHPLCAMQISFVRDTQVMHGRSNQPIYLASDGQGILSDYINSPNIAGTAINRPNVQFKDATLRTKYFDMFMLLNADLALLNPRSTYSWEVFVVRAALGLLSVPKPVGTDLYFFSEAESYTDMRRKNVTWVSWESIERATRRASVRSTSQQPGKNHVYDYDVCVSTKVKILSETMICNFIEWLEYHFILGVDHVFIVEDCCQVE